MKKYLPYIILIIAGIIVFGNTLNHSFVLDDHAIILNHQHVQNGISGISDIVSSNYLNGVQEFNDGLYRPLSPALFAIQNEFWSNSPYPGHLFNIIYAILTAILVFTIFKELFNSSPNIAILFSLVYLVLPIHTEVVANIKGSDEMLALIFVLSSLIFFNRYMKSEQIKNLVIGGVLFFIGLFSKESTFTFVAIVPIAIYLLYPEKKKQIYSIVSITGISGAIFLLIRKLVLDSMPNPVDEGSLSGLNNSILATDVFVEKLGTAFSLQILYLFKTIVPYSLQHDYSFNEIPIVSIFSFSAIAGLLLFLAILYFIWKFKNTVPLISIGLGWYLGSLIIVSNLFFPIGATFAERFLYTPSLGILIAIYGFVQHYYAPIFQNKIFWIAASFIVLIYTGITIKRNKDWKDNFTLYSQDYPKLQNSARGNYNYGTVCNEQSIASNNVRKKNELYTQAVNALNRAIEIYPKYYDAYNNLGITYHNQKRYPEAISTLNKLLELDPNYKKGWYNLAANYYAAQDYDNALNTFDTYTSLDMNNADVWYFKGMCFGFKNNFNAAIEALNKSIEIQPNHVDALLMLGKAQGILKNYDLSEYYFNKVLSIQPSNQEARQNLQMTKEIKAGAAN